jgi:C1A family cysteine protease
MRSREACEGHIKRNSKKYPNHADPLCFGAGKQIFIRSFSKTIRPFIVLVIISAFFFIVCAAAGSDEMVQVSMPPTPEAEIIQVNLTAWDGTGIPSPMVTVLTLNRSGTETTVVRSADTTISPAVSATGSVPFRNPSLAPPNPAFLAYQDRMKAASVQDFVSRQVAAFRSTETLPSYSFVEGEIPSPVDLSQNLGQHLVTESGSRTDQETYSGSYDLRPLGKVSPVRDQGSAGSCWAFGTYGSLESTLLTAESWDLSENHMKNTLASTYPDGFDRAWNGGGNEWMSSAYLTRWSGAIRESDDPYSDSSGVSPAGLIPVKHAQNIYFLPARSSPTDNDNIKYALTTWGAVKASIYWASAYYNAATGSFYNDGSRIGTDPYQQNIYSTNHAITLVGWDDSYSRSNFIPAAAGDGAFIAKNSWGPAWGDNGFFHISYYDITVGNRSVVFTAEPTTNYDRVYSNDPLGWTTDFGFGTPSAQYANIYTTQSFETLRAVGFYTLVSNTSYTVTVYRDPDSGPINTLGPASGAAGTLSSPGYHTVVVPEVNLTSGQPYSIVVSVTTPGNNYPIPIEYPFTGYSSHATALPGESYVSSDGAVWTDITSMTLEDPNYAKTNVCLKGYTTFTSPPAITSVTPGEGYLNSTVTFSVTGTNLVAETGNTWINFTRGAGTSLFDNLNISLTSVTGTTINGTMVVGTDAPPGSWNLTLTTLNNGTSPARTDAITITTLPVPEITSVSPSTPWLRNSTVSYSVNGTYFKPGQTYVYLLNQTNGAILNITALHNITTTHIEGTVLIPMDAPLGDLWQINISTIDSGGNGTILSPFTISQNPSPTITSLTPATGFRNSTVNFTITGTNFEPAKTLVAFRNQTNGALLNTSVVFTVSNNTITGYIGIPPDAPTGFYGLEVATLDCVSNGTKQNALLVTKVLAPTTTSITPAFGYKNTTTNFTLVGTNFLTAPGKTWVRIYEDAADTELDISITSISPTTILGSISIPNSAYPGPYTIEVATIDGGTAIKTPGFSVGYLQAPIITSMSPDYGFRNDTIGITITGTNFEPGKTTVTLRNQTTNAILNSMVPDRMTGTSIVGNLTIPNTSPTGYYRLDVITTDGGVANRRNAFRVNAVTAPTITTITPRSGTKNSVVAFTLLGTSFQADEKTAVKILDDTTGTELATTLYRVNPTKIIGSFSIPSTVPAGRYRLRVTTVDGGIAGLPEAFTVSSQPLPTIITLTPANGNKNSTVPFVLKGNYFVDGGTVVRLRTMGTTINATLASVNMTQVIGSFTINTTAGAGPYRLDVITNGGGFSSMPNAFMVNSNLKPAISSLSPTSGSRNTPVAFTLAGSNFQNGGTAVVFKNQSVNSSVDTIVQMEPTILSVTSTQIIGSLSIPANATTNIWKINVTTINGGEVSKARAFIVK